MLLLRGEAFDRRIRECQHEAFHLELQDEYNTADGVDPYQNWLDGNPDDYAWFQAWLSLVRDMTSRGAVMRRARVVTVPHTDYTRWLLEVSRESVNAGEDIRYLPRHEVDSEKLTGDDWWLFDNDTVAFTAFEPDGRLGGGAITTDPRIVEYCRSVRDYVWKIATPYDEYTR
ncbi:DUF6879 family protein [Nocardia carnea]|uniref:DUF6879 family protein n=1 Tax=Nocardia carnea TaxID=37328 RepID=UPI0024557508|nr:DUF6879 family protein [Nocardia carnea]